MAYIRVTYGNGKYIFDYVSTDQLACLIARDEITHFFRPSEGRWVNVRCDQIRGNGGFYQGPERRKESARLKEDQRFNGKMENENWMENLWADIEN